MKNLALFFPHKDSIVVLPKPGNARLYLVSKSMIQRWKHSSLYPAFRTSARMFRQGLRLKTALGINRTWINDSFTWELGEFVHDIFPGASSVVALVGTPGPTQKIIAQLWDENQVVGYVKYTEKPAARKRLKSEYELLKKLPDGLGPMPRKYGPFADGDALVLNPVTGKHLPARVPPPVDIAGFLNKLKHTESFLIKDHPWTVRMLNEHGRAIEKWLGPLRDQVWPVVFEHGDCAPWNILRGPDKGMCAIDWEHGTTKGFPYLDLAYYILQVSFLIHHWKPRKAYNFAHQQLSKELTPEKASSVIKLSAFDANQKALKDGHKSDERLLTWRKSLWEQTG